MDICEKHELTIIVKVREMMGNCVHVLLSGRWMIIRIGCKGTCSAGQAVGLGRGVEYGRQKQNIVDMKVRETNGNCGHNLRARTSTG